MPSDATVVSKAGPITTIGQAVNQTPHGGTIVVRAGTYHEQVQVYEKRLTIQAWPDEAVWLDGSTRITSWTPAGAFWRTAWRSPFPVTTSSNGIVSSSNPAAGHLELVFRDGVPQRQVLTFADLGAGEFYVDRPAGQLYIGSSPFNVDVTDLAWALYFNRAHDSQLLDIGVRRYATPPANMAAVRAYGDRIVLDRIDVQDTALSAVSIIGNQVTLRDSTIVDAGMIGVHGNNADNVRIERNVVTNANRFGFNAGHSAAGMKLTRSRHVLIDQNTVTNAAGPGIWVDQDAYDTTVVRNTVVGSHDEGVEIELAGHTTVADNHITDSGDMGVKLLDSNDIHVRDNLLERNRTHIETFDGYRDADDTSSADHDFRFPVPQPGITWNTHDIAIRNNVMVDGCCGAVTMVNTDDITHTSNATALEHHRRLRHLHPHRPDVPAVDRTVGRLRRIHHPRRLPSCDRPGATRRRQPAGTGRNPAAGRGRRTPTDTGVAGRTAASRDRPGRFRAAPCGRRTLCIARRHPRNGAHGAHTTMTG